MNFGGGSNRRTRVARAHFLLDCNSRGKALDVVYFGLLELAQKLSGIGRQRFDVPALAFGVQGVKCERGFARSAHPGNHHQMAVRKSHMNVFQVVHAGTFYADFELFHGQGANLPLCIPRKNLFLERVLRRQNASNIQN